MAKDFSSNQPRPQVATEGEFGPHESGTPVTGFTQAPTVDDAMHNFETGPGVPANTSSKLH